MPDTRHATGAPRRIAVVGAGIAGMSAAHDLARDHDVTLFEADGRLGGHARTLMAGKTGQQPVDTGFIVFNAPNYPHLSRLFEELEVPVTEADMSFSVSLDQGAFEYAFRKERPLRAIFAQPRNALDPRFWGMLRDVMRFNAQARNLGQDAALDFDGLLKRLGTGAWLRDRFLVPFTGAIWSTPTQKVRSFPAKSLVDFLENHGLLTHHAHPQWYSVDGGSIIYVEKLRRAILSRGARIHTGHPVEAIRRQEGGAMLRVRGAWEKFDAVVLAVHADQALRLLEDPSEHETQTLGQISFLPNTAVLHADADLMPKRRACWAAWNHIGATDAPDRPISITYWMNALQTSIPVDDPLFLTLNPDRPVDETCVYDQHVFRHPAYDHASVAARQAIRAGNGARDTWFCGAWLQNGFHEDGINSAYEVTTALRDRMTASVG